MNPISPGDGFRFLIPGESPRKGDEFYDAKSQEWRPVNWFWSKQFGNPEVLKRRPTLLDWSFCDVTNTWSGVLCFDSGQVNADGAVIVLEYEAMIWVDRDGWFVAQWQMEGMDDETRHSGLWRAVAFCEGIVEESMRVKKVSQ